MGGHQRGRPDGGARPAAGVGARVTARWWSRWMRAVPPRRPACDPGTWWRSSGGATVQDADEFQARLRGYPARAPVPLLLWRDGHRLAVTVIPAEFSPQQVDALAWDRLGLRLTPSRGTLAVSGVRPGSQAEAIRPRTRRPPRPAEQRRTGLTGRLPGGAGLGPARALGAAGGQAWGSELPRHIPPVGSRWTRSPRV